MHLVRHMKSSTSESKSNFCRSIRLAQSNRTAGRPKYKSVDPNWFIRRSLHAPNQMIRFGSCKVRRMNRASDAKITLKNVYCVFVAYFAVFTWAPSTRSSSESGKALRFFFLLLFFPRAQRGGDRQTPIKILGHFFCISLTVVLEITLRVLRKLWNVCKLCRETQKAWRHNHVYILSSKHPYRPMRARVLSQIFFGNSKLCQFCSYSNNSSLYINVNEWKIVFGVW